MNSSSKPRILLSNDDGIDTHGLKILFDCAAEHGEVFVSAPDKEQSSTSMSLTLHKPILYREERHFHPHRAFRVFGTPTDSVKFALGTHFLENPPDLLISGINVGDNSGKGIWYSGTVGCAIEGALKGIPSIAFSVFEEKTLLETKEFLNLIIANILSSPPKPGTLYNVNFPKGLVIKGLKVAQQSPSMMMEKIYLRNSPRERPYFWLGGKYFNGEEVEGNEKVYLDQGFATIAPLHVGDITHREEVERLGNLDWNASNLV